MTEWTKEPPTEPGWYWWRSTGTVILQIPLRLSDGKWRFGAGKFAAYGGEWWPEPIQEPQ